MNNTARPTDRKISTSASLFKKLLQAFANGDLPYSDVQSDLQRLLTTGASPEELREVMHRYESIEPLPARSHAEILRILDEAIERAAALKSDPDAAPSQVQGTQSATAIPASVPEPMAAPVDTRTLPASVSAVAATPRPVMARATARSGEPTASPAENVSSIEERIARQKADYKALNNAYERVRDAGSAASARTTALTAELAAVRSALEAEQTRSRTLDKALVESMASGEAARTRGAEARRELERDRMEQRSARDLLAARDATIDQLRLSLSERENQLSALQRDHASRQAALDTRAFTGTQLEAELRAERTRSTALEAELGAARNALIERDGQLVALQREHARISSALESRTTNNAQLEADLQTSRARALALTADLASAHATVASEHDKTRESRKALAERTAADEAARSDREDLLRKSEMYRAELSKVRGELNTARDSLAARQSEHTKIVAALEARTKALEAQLQAALTRVDEKRLESAATQEITVALDRPQREYRPAPAVSAFDAPPFDAAQTVSIAAPTASIAAPAISIAAPESKRAAQLPEFPLFGSRGRRTAGAVARLVGVGAAIAVLAVVAWIIVHHAPESENVPAGSAALPKSGTVIRDCPACPALTVVPKGRFKQGSDRAGSISASFEKPVHWVSIDRPFAISTNAVTVDEFRAFIAATGRDMRGCDTYDDKWRYRQETSWENPGFVQTGSHPVTCVSWDDAKAYAAWLSTTTGQQYRLPSAADWEYAARAGGEAVQPWNAAGASASASANVADQRAARRYPGWTVFACDDGYVYTAPVGSFKANSFGLNDMLGNVFQWTDDCWHPDYAGVPTDGSARTYGDCSERELRGGSWYTTPEFVRASYRNHFQTNYRASSVGIRVVRDIQP